MALTDDQIIEKVFEKICAEEPWSSITRADIKVWLKHFKPLIEEDPEPEQEVRPILFIGDFEQYSTVDNAERRAKELAELGHKVSMINVVIDPDGNPFGLQYEAIISATVAESEPLEL